MTDTYRAVKRLRFALGAIALGVLTACEPSAPPDPPKAAAVAAAPAILEHPPSAPTVSAVRIDAGFRSRQRLADHYAKHGSEFGKVSQDEYLRLAQALRDAPVGADVLEIRRGDGTVSRFDRKSGAFIAFDADGTIRTFFRPNDGEAYFQRQARRRGDP